MTKSTFLKSLFCCVALFFSLQAKLQIITTVAGNGIDGYSGDGGLAVNARLDGASDVDFDALGNMYILQSGLQNVVRKVNVATHIITTVAGNGTAGYSGDGGLATQAQIYANSMAVDSSGNIYLSEQGNFRVRRIDAISGIITTIAGTGVNVFSGDGGPAVNAAYTSRLVLHLTNQDTAFISLKDKGAG